MQQGEDTDEVRTALMHGILDVDYVDTCYVERECLIGILPKTIL